MTQTIPLSNIVVLERQRKDLGDIQSLAESMRENGIIQPIVLDDDNQLLAGRRRLEAARVLGWADIPFVRMSSLTPTQKQIIELEEDIRRKDRTWQEKCLATARIHALKKAEAALDGESWTVRTMAAFTGLSKSQVNYMVQVATELQQDPAGPVSKASTYIDAIKAMLLKREQEVATELEKRRHASVLPEVKPSKEPTLTVAKTVIRLNGKNQTFQWQGEGRFIVAVAHRLPVPAFLPLYHALRADGVAVLWENNPSAFNAIKEQLQATGFVVQPFPLIWHTMFAGEETEWPFSRSYRIGIVVAKQPRKETATNNLAVVSCVPTDDGLPLAVMAYTLKALSNDGTDCLLPNNNNALAVAQLGRIPYFYEPDPAVFNETMLALKDYYCETVPNVEFVV